MLADAASVVDGKLYVHGGAWDHILTQSFPSTHPSLAVVVTLEVPYDQAMQEHRLLVELVTEDGEATPYRAEGLFRLGHPPMLARGAPVFQTSSLTFPMLRFERPGRYAWMVSCDGDVLGSIPLTIELRPSLQPRS